MNITILVQTLILHLDWQTSGDSATKIFFMDLVNWWFFGCMVPSSMRPKKKKGIQSTIISIYTVCDPRWFCCLAEFFSEQREFYVMSERDGCPVKI